MIKIFSDIEGLMQLQKDVIVLNKIEDYVTGYDHILKAIDNDNDVTVYIQDPTVEIWIKRMASRYPEGLFDFQTMDARGYLAQKWGILIPDYVTNEDIISTGLLDDEITPHSGATFENVLLEHFYDPIFASSIFPATKITDIIFAYDEPIWQKNSANKLLFKIYQNQLNTWRKKAKNPVVPTVIDMIEEDILKLKIALMKYKVLRSYPEIGKKLLGSIFRTLDTLKPNLQTLEIDDRAISDVVSQIEYFLNDLKPPQDTEQTTLYVNKLSGLLLLEFEKVENLLIKNPQFISIKVIGALEGVFSPIKNKVQKRIDKLKALLKPPPPEYPDTSWTVDNMLKWATELYLPFFGWADSNGLIDDDLVKKGDFFAQWLYSNWESLRASSKRMVFNILSNFSKDFQNSDIINLMIIVDNLGWKYTRTLKELFQHEGFAVTRIEPYLSMLPSLTEISKKCLLSGNPTYSEIDNTQYTAIVEKGWVPYFNDSKFLYLPDINTLLTLPNIECQTYIVNYLPIDKTLHQPESTLGLPHDVHIKTLLERLVDMVLEFINKHNLKDKITIHITSDHCSTKIPQTLKNQIDTSFFKSADFEHITPRLVAVKTERFDNLPDNLKEDCFFLDQGKFGNDRYYLSARRSNRFSKLDNNCYVHGGISPEEVIVPYMAVQKIISTIKDLTIVLIKTTYRYKLETIELEIANPNESSAENITVEIINSNIESEVYPLDWLEGKRKTSAAIQARFKKTQSQDDSKYLNISLTFESNGERHQCEPIKLPITMKSMFEIKDKTIFDGLD